MRDLKKKSRVCKERYNWYKEHGLCTSCGAAWVVPGHVRCKACEAKIAAYHEKSLDKRREQQRLRRQERIENGLCVECGNPAAPGMRMCGRCRNMRNDSTRKYKIKQRTKKMMQGKVIPVLEEKGRHNKKEATR